MCARAILGEIAEVVYPTEGSFDSSGFSSVVEAIIIIIIRHPMRQDELERSLTRWTPGHVAQALAELEASSQTQVVERLGMRFGAQLLPIAPMKRTADRLVSKCKPGLLPVLIPGTWIAAPMKQAGRHHKCIEFASVDVANLF